MSVAARVGILRAEDARRDLDQVRLQLAPIPSVERVGQLGVGQAADVLQES